MFNNEWRVILMRVLAMSIFVWGIAVGYFFFTPSASERNLAVVFVLVALVVIGWSWRKLRSLKE